jgi:pyoverdine/dityrosine biosynthesis protein Dit1
MFVHPKWKQLVEELIVSATLTPDRVHEISSENPVVYEDAAQHFLFSESTYARNLVFDGYQLQTDVLCWRHQHLSSNHTHSQSDCGFRGQASVASEAIYGPGEAGPVAVQQEKLRAGDVVSAPASFVHKIENAEVSDLITPSVSAEFSTQPINPSYLTSPKNWPDPSGTTQATRPATDIDRLLVQACANQVNVLDPNFRKQVRANTGTFAERLTAILCSGTLNFNGGRVRAAVGPRIAAACSAAEPLRIVMPAFCRIGNTAKLMYSLRPTAAEEVSLGHLSHIARSLSTLYSPGVQFVLLSDARLYGPRLLNPVPTVSAYNKALHEICSNVAPDGEVELIEYDELLGAYASEFENAYQRGIERVAARDPAMFAELSREELYESVRASLNTSTLGMTYDDLFECFSHQRNPDNRFYKLLADQTEESVKMKMAMRFACHELEGRVLTNQFGPHYIRATIHVSRSSPVLGLRIYPDYKRSSDQLPYHGVPLLYREGERIKMLVAPETRFWRDGSLERVTHQNGETYFYQSRVAQ